MSNMLLRRPVQGEETQLWGWTSAWELWGFFSLSNTQEPS